MKNSQAPNERAFEKPTLGKFTLGIVDSTMFEVGGVKGYQYLKICAAVNKERLFVLLVAFLPLA